MKHKESIKNLNGMALKTSFVLGILFAMPLFKHAPFSWQYFLLSALFATLLSLSTWGINIFLVYLSEKYNLQKHGNKPRVLASFLLNFLIIVFLYFVFKVSADFLPPFLKQIVLTKDIIHHFIAYSFVLNTIILIIQEGILLNNRKIMIELENAQLKTKNSEAYYAQLKQQIHPHFLFNSLNILKTLIKKDPEIAVDYLVKLSDFLRTSISSNNENVVKLEDELKMCIDYLEMQKLRFGKALEFKFDLTENLRKSGFVPVFSIQLLLENSIKHNSLTMESPLQVNISEDSGYITVRNNIQKKMTSEISTGLGLSNLSERYKILSGDDIVVTNNGKEFCVRIKILNP